jgi:hypothetical protein
MECRKAREIKRELAAEQPERTETPKIGLICRKIISAERKRSVAGKSIRHNRNPDLNSRAFVEWPEMFSN